MASIFWLIVAITATSLPNATTKPTEEELKEALRTEYEEKASAICTKLAEADWAYKTDIANQDKLEDLVDATLRYGGLKKLYWEHYFEDLSPGDYKDEQLKRHVAKILKILENAALEEEKLKTLTIATMQMISIYSTAKVCPHKKQKCALAAEGLSLKAGIDERLAKSQDYDELVYLWKAWRDASGAKMRDLYKTYVDLSNEAAKANGFKDKGEFWRDSYESETFIKDVDNLWKEVEPLYVELHKYAGKKLKEVYGDKLDISDGLIPAHVFGDMWAEDWRNLAKLLRPFPKTSSVDIDAALKKQNYTVLEMFEKTDKFYTSMGLLPNDISYNTTAGAMIEKPTDGREVVCEANAWDFCDGKNYRVQMCANVSFHDFTTVHHEMGHIQYFLQYAKQPYNFREGANPGFHEAIGDTIALSVTTPKHLKKIGLIKSFTNNEKASINALMDMALQKVALMPLAFLVDKWRWDVFSGKVKPKEWNSHWWKYREKYQRVKAPIKRSDKTDFDPGARFHVASDFRSMAHFVGHILQFQLYRSLCIEAGEYDPKTKKVLLSKCDFYKSTAAGKKLSAGLKLGASKHWSEVLRVMTGEKTLNAAALMEYFEPLYKWLKDVNCAEFTHVSMLMLIITLMAAQIL